MSAEDWQCIRQHPVLGAEMLTHSSSMDVIRPLVLYHHERYDGRGYPDGLTGEDIPLGARIIAVADAYHAMTSDRPYQSRRSLREAICELDTCSGTQFDPGVIQVFVAMMSREVRLKSRTPHRTDGLLVSGG